MSRALDVSFGDARRNPRTRRAQRCLADAGWRVTALCRGGAGGEDIAHIPLTWRLGRAERLYNLVLQTLALDGPAVWNGGMRALARDLAGRGFELVVCHDLALLPLAHAAADGAPVIFDAREYYPRQFEDRPLWNLAHRGFNMRLVRRWMARCAHVFTVSEGIAERYEQDTGVRPEVLPSWPDAVDLEPSPVDPQRIRIVHHGNANRSRGIDAMLDVMEHVDERFSLDLLLWPSDRRVLARLERRAEGMPNVRVLPPLPFVQLVRETNAYDIGLHMLPPVSFNHRHALPNKFFEYIQARLAVAVGPTREMARIVRERGLGLVADDFDPRSMARALCALDAGAVERLKAASHRAAGEMTSAATNARLLEVVQRVAPQAARAARGGGRP